MSSSVPILQFQNLGLSLLLGLLVGLQRESVESRMAGLRTYPLITLWGTLCTYLAERFGVWVIVAGFTGVLGCVILGNIGRWKNPKAEIGITTEIVIFLMFAIGAYVPVGPWVVSVAIVAVVAVLLQFKLELHGVVTKLGREDLTEIMKLVVVWCIILPLLPNETFGPFDVLNPHDIWRMVVLVMSISVVGYISYKFLGQRAGTFLAAIFGGMVSSTATTVSYSKHTRSAAGTVRNASVIIAIASAIVYFRVLFEIRVTAPSFFDTAAPPLLALGIFSILCSGIAWFWRDGGDETQLAQRNPGALKSALTFGVLYSFILIMVAVGKHYFGTQGLYVVGGISGMTDMDAITLSTARMVEKGQIAAQAAWPVIVVAVISNLIFKFLITVWWGSRELARRMLIIFSVNAAAALAVIFLWPSASG